MAFYDLREYLDHLGEQGEGKQVEASLNAQIEVGALAQRMAEKGGPAIQFLSVEGANQGVTLACGFINPGVAGLWSKASLLLGLDKKTSYPELIEELVVRRQNPVRPMQVGGGAVKENVLTGSDANLDLFPWPTLHEGDQVASVCSWGFIVVKEPGSDYTIWNAIALVKKDNHSMNAVIDPRSELGKIFHKYQQQGKEMPYALVMGGSPILTVAAQFKRQRGDRSTPEIAGGLQKSPVQLVKCETSDLLVPANAEMIIEGVVCADESPVANAVPGSFGYRASALPGAAALFKVTAMTYRNEPIIPIATSGIPVTDKHAAMTLGADSQLKESFEKKGLPVKSVYTPPMLGGTVIAVTCKVPFTAFSQSVAGIIRTTVSTETIPYILVCDDDIDLTNLTSLFHAMVTKCHPSRDTWKIQNAKGSRDNPHLTSDEQALEAGSCMIVDCTWPLDWDPSIAVPPRVSFDQCYPVALQEKVLKEWHEELGFPVKP